MALKKVKKIPQRKCIVCQDRDSKKELMRIVKNKEGEIFLDPSGRANGRGAYICKDTECLKKAIKTKALKNYAQPKPIKILIASQTT